MASFVTEILANAGKLEKEDFNSKIVKLFQRIDQVKVDTYEFLLKRYEEFHPNFDLTVDLSNRIEKIFEEMHSLTNKIEIEVKSKLNLSTNEFYELSQQLKENIGLLTILNKLLNIHDEFCVVDKLIGKNYLLAAKSLQTIQHLFDNPVHEREEEIRILKALQTEYRYKKEKLIYDLSEMWKEMIKFDILNDKIVELHVCNMSLEENKIEVLVQALYFVGAFEYKLKEFSRNLMHYIVNPLTKQEVDLKIVTKTSSEVLEMTYKISDLYPKLTDVLLNLDNVFSFLHRTVFYININENNKTAMSCLGSIMGEEISKTIIQNVLTQAIPTNNKDLEKFDEVIHDIEKLQKKLIMLDFIDTNQTSIVDYAKNVNVLFANKKCQNILEKARSLMLSDLHNTIQIFNDISLGELLQLETDEIQGTKVKPNPLQESYLSDTTFKLPKCQISAIIPQLLHLIYDTLHEAAISNPNCGDKLFYTARNIIEMFCDVVPTYHRASLSSDPKLAALHHNNCMYIAHHLLVLGHQFRSLANKLLIHSASIFVDQIPILRKLGTEHFLQQMAIQRSKLMELISQAHGFQNLSTDENVYPDAEKAIKLCIEHLEILSNIWKLVLPIHIYQKAIGTLLSSVLLEMVNRITALEDISASDASQLHVLLSKLTHSSPKLFQDEKENNNIKDTNLFLHVPKWMKFKELLIILNASLQDILDRWTDGKGPLAQEFLPTEIKQLIRALFQNTDRRAATLAKIK